MVTSAIEIWRRGNSGRSNQLRGTNYDQGYELRRVQFVEFLRRALDFPRRQMIDPYRPNFQDLLTARVAQAWGAKVTLPPEIYLRISARARDPQQTQRS